MLTVKNGRKKVRVFTFLHCRKCEAVYAYIKEDRKQYVGELFKDRKAYSHDDFCPNCKGVLREFELTEENYIENCKGILCTDGDKTRVLLKDELFIFI